MQFGWINAVNAAYVILLITISVIGQKKSGLPPLQSRRAALNIGEQAGRYACMALLVLPLLPRLEFGFASPGAMTAWLVSGPALLLCYALLWTRAKRGGAALYGLAVVPAVLFLCCGVLLRHRALCAAAVLFGVCHTAIVRETQRAGKNEA